MIIKRNLFEIGFKGIHFEAENQFYNLSKEKEAPRIQGHPKDRDHHWQYPILVLTSRCATRLTKDVQHLTYNLSKEKEGPQIQGPPEDRDHHQQYPILVLTSRCASRITMDIQHHNYHSKEKEPPRIRRTPLIQEIALECGSLSCKFETYMLNPLRDIRG